MYLFWCKSFNLTNFSRRTSDFQLLRRRCQRKSSWLYSLWLETVILPRLALIFLQKLVRCCSNKTWYFKNSSSHCNPCDFYFVFSRKRQQRRCRGHLFKNTLFSTKIARVPDHQCAHILFASQWQCLVTIHNGNPCSVLVNFSMRRL